MKSNKTYNSFFLLSMFLFFIQGQLLAQGAAEKAKNNFEKGAFEEALNDWYHLVQSGNSSAGLYYNIGLAESALHHTGKSILAYEQALRIKPGSRVIRKAIEAERENIENAAIPVAPFFLKAWYQQIVMLFRPGLWAMLWIGSMLALMFRFLIGLKQKSIHWLSHLKSIRFWILGAGLLLLFSFLSYAELHRANEAIIGVPCTFHQAPSEDSPSISEIGEGEKVIIADQIGEWFNVYLLNQDAGWVRKECLIPIKIGIQP